MIYTVIAKDQHNNVTYMKDCYTEEDAKESMIAVKQDNPSHDVWIDKEMYWED